MHFSAFLGQFLDDMVRDWCLLEIRAHIDLSDSTFSFSVLIGPAFSGESSAQRALSDYCLLLEYFLLDL